MLGFDWWIDVYAHVTFSFCFVRISHLAKAKIYCSFIHSFIHYKTKPHSTGFTKIKLLHMSYSFVLIHSLID